MVRCDASQLVSNPGGRGWRYHGEECLSNGIKQLLIWTYTSWRSVGRRRAALVTEITV